MLPIMLLTASCDKKQGGASDPFKPEITGQAGEVLVVTTGTAKEDTACQALGSVLEQVYLGLPSDEPYFNMLAVPRKFFDFNLHKHRNIIQLSVSDTVSADTLRFFYDIWAKPQAVVEIMAKSDLSAAALVKRHEIRLVSFFTKIERERLLSYFTRINDQRHTTELRKRWGVTMVVPNFFDKCTPADKESMSWFMSDTKEYFDGIVVYDYPYVGPESLSKDTLIARRDSILRKNIGGPNNSQMCTELREGAGEVIYKYGPGMHSGADVAELRGLWRMDGAAMGGPFIMRAVLDAKRQRVVVTDGYVYYPSRERKRNHIRQLEAMMHTLKFSDDK